MPAMTYRNERGETVRAIQVSPHEKVADLRAFCPGLRYYPDAGLVYPNDSDEPVALHPDRPFFHVGLQGGRVGYLNDWITKSQGGPWEILRDATFRLIWRPIPGTEEHADHKGPVAPTTDLLGGSMSGEFPAYNLEDALASEARSIAQLILNLQYLSGNVGGGFFGGGAANEWTRSDWPIATTVEYQSELGGFAMRYVRLEDIYMVKTGAVDWREEQVHDRVTDLLLERKYNPPAGSKVDASYSVKFGAVRTREEATKVGLENEITLRLGGINSPAGAVNNATISAEASKRYGETHTFEETISDTITIEGPADLILKGERSRSQVSQVVKAVPEFEYKIIVGMREGGDGKHYFREAEFESKAQFNAWIQGRASDDVGVVYQYTALVTKDQLRTWQTAPTARAHRQPDAVVSTHHVPLVFSTSFDDQVSQGVEFYDAQTGERVNPFDYSPGRGAPVVNG